MHSRGPDDYAFDGGGAIPEMSGVRATADLISCIRRLARVRRRG